MCKNKSRYILNLKVYRHPTVLPEGIFTSGNVRLGSFFIFYALYLVIGNNIVENISSSLICI